MKKLARLNSAIGKKTFAIYTVGFLPALGYGAEITGWDDKDLSTSQTMAVKAAGLTAGGINKNRALLLVGDPS